MYLSQLRMENFKSIRDQSFDLSKVNVLIGRNGSGKTNILEFLKLIKLAVTSNSVPFNPFIHWWGYSNVVWRRDTTLDIKGEFTFLPSDLERSRIINRGNSTGSVAFSNVRDIIYSIALGMRDDIPKITHEYVVIPDIVRIERIGDVIKYTFFEHFYKNFIKEELEEIRAEIEKVFTDEDALPYTKLIDGLSHELTFTERVRSRFLPGLTINPQSIFGTALNFSFLDLARFAKNKSSELLYIERTINLFLRLIRDFFTGIVFLRPPDLRKIRESVFLVEGEELKEDGSNLVQVLYNLQNNRRGENVREIIGDFYQDSSIGFRSTQDGRLMLIVYEGDLELRPHGISDGFYKLLFVLTGLFKTSSLLLIDEIENSLHFEAIEFILDTIRHEDVQTLMTTHSPVIIDLTDLQNMLVCTKYQGETKIKKPRNIPELKKQLTELKLSHSDAWAVGRFEE